MYETDVVVPQELRLDEVHLLQGAYRWSRGRRRRSDHQHEDHLFLRLPAFGKELYLQLQRDDSFLAEGFVTEERGEEGSVQHEPVLRVRRCFYTGAVLNHTDSFASLDTCGTGEWSSGFLGGYHCWENMICMFIHETFKNISGMYFTPKRRIRNNLHRENKCPLFMYVFIYWHSW